MMEQIPDNPEYEKEIAIMYEEMVKRALPAEIID